MGYSNRLQGVLLVCALTIPSTDQESKLFAQGGSAHDELTVTYPRVPKRLDSDPGVASVLLVDIDLKGVLRLNALEGAAFVAVGSGKLSRASTMKGDVVMFHDLPAGSYSLRFVRMGNGNATVIVEKATSPDILVTVAPGVLSYLGTVVVTKKVGFKPPDIQLTYDANRELEAWLAFQKKYGDSPWSRLAETQIQALRSGQTSASAERMRSDGESAAVEQSMLALSEIGISNVRNGQYVAAVRAYEEALRMRPDSTDLARSKARRWVQNNLAWLLATAPDSTVRDGPRALVLAEQLVAWKRDDAAYLDTFAAAYAEVGRFDEAVKIQQEALAGLGRGSLRDGYRKHLTSYQDGKPWREP